MIWRWVLKCRLSGILYSNRTKTTSTPLNTDLLQNRTLPLLVNKCRVKTELDGTRAETRFGLPAKRTSTFISAGVSVQSAAGSRDRVPIQCMSAGYPPHSPLSPSLLLPCFAVCHQIPFPLYQRTLHLRFVDLITYPLNLCVNTTYWRITKLRPPLYLHVA